MVRVGVVVLGQLLLATTLLAACGGDLRVPFAPGGNDPIPLPPDLDVMLRGEVGFALGAADGTPLVSADKALEVAGMTLREEMEGNNVPANDPPGPLALVRRALVEHHRPDEVRPAVNVWVVAYRWKYDCHDPNGGPGPCPTTSFYFIDDRTGAVVTSYGVS
ncbi:MAG: hypothetical protein ACJ77D_09355 [Chloroflexota bacterium]